ncbi:MAG: glycoside hydrolase family 99-like domain-containing protein [Pseudomonadota bacterium]
MARVGRGGLLILLLGLSSSGAWARSTRDHIGVYYFPGWLTSDWAPKGAWEPIKAYPDREPLLGWYDQKSKEVLARQLHWMAQYHLDYVVMDWYYEQGAVRLDEGLKAFLAVPQSQIKLSLLWANHGEQTTPAIFRAITQAWILRYFSSSNYLTKDGRPVVFIFSYDKLAADARASGSSVKYYLDIAQSMAKSSGLKGIYFVADVDDFSPAQIENGAAAAGFSAVSSYQFHRKPQVDEAIDPHWGRPTHGWTELATAYQAQWRAGLKLSIPMVVPMISGLDRRPWGGFPNDSLHDRSLATDQQFKSHLAAARRTMTQTTIPHSRLGVICCWNEYGEGAFVEPTRANGFKRLSAIKSVFGH